jgi:serine protease
MAAKRIARWLVVGVALAALAGCDQVQDRLNKFGKLTDEVLKQVSGADGGGDSAPVDLLAAAPLEARALFGKMQAVVDVTPVNIEEALQTQSFYAVGSVIAMPKEQVVVPVVEPESFDLSAADPSKPDTAADAAAVNSAQAPPPESADKPAGAPVTEAPLAPAPAPESAQLPQAGGATPKIPMRSLSTMKAPPTAGELRQRALVVAPRVLQKAVRDSGLAVNKDSLKVARQSAEQGLQATSKTAQSLGDDLARKTMIAVPNAPSGTGARPGAPGSAPGSAPGPAPIPKALAVRSKLNVDAALAVRDRMSKKLELYGLSSIVTPTEGGQMRITLGVNPTKMGDKFDPTKVASVRALFAKSGDPKKDCAGNPDPTKLKQDLALATECAVKLLQDSGEYKYVEKDYIFTNQMLKKPKTAKPVTAIGATPNDPLFSLQWDLKDNGAAAGQSGGGAGFSNFWTRAKDTGSRSVTVAIVDTGIQMNHPDIKGSPNLAPGYDMVSDPTIANDGDGRDNDPNDPGDRCDPNDPNSSDSFHGTHVAGTIGVASTNNAAGIAGGAWDVTIVPVRALGRCGGAMSDINDAIRWAAGTVPARDSKGNEIWNSHPADIINMSIGLFGPCPQAMQAAIDDAVAHGAIVVVAAGNARVDAKYFAPGGCKNVISVAANDARGILAPYSNFGPDVSIMAPGGDMTRDDDHDGRPDGILSTKYSTDCYDPTKPDTKVAQCYYSYENGTSMAAPHVTAALALLKAKFPNALPSELRTKLLASSMPRDALQCSGKCSNYPGTTPIPGSDGMCLRECGGKMLNLANAPLQ